MRRTARPLVVLAAVLAAGAWAQDQRPLPRGGPEGFVPPAPPIHLRLHEDLDPDLLRGLIRPGVTVWLSTSSNTLRDSTLEHLARAETAWVQLRSPLKPVDARMLVRLPKAGAWVTPEALGVVGRLPGVRRVAAWVTGPLAEADLLRLAAVHPAELRWTPPDDLDLLAWGQFQRLPGRKVLAPSRSQPLQRTACEVRSRAEPALEAHVSLFLSLAADAWPCGAGTRVVVEPDAQPWLLDSLVVRDPSVELVVEVGADAARARATRALLDRLLPGR